MTASPRIDPARLLEEQLAQAGPDLLRELLTVFLNRIARSPYWQSGGLCALPISSPGVKRRSVPMHVGRRVRGGRW